MSSLQRFVPLAVRSLCLLAAVLVCSPAARALAPSPSTVTVGWGPRLYNVGSAIVNLGVGSFGLTNTTPNGYTPQSWRAATFQVGKVYRCSVSWSGVQWYGLMFSIPEGYQMYVDGFPNNAVAAYVDGAGGTKYFTLQFRAIGYDVGSGANQLGEFSGVDFGQSVSWRVSLGGTVGGVPAGQLGIRLRDFTDSPASRDKLMFASPSTLNYYAITTDGPSNQRLRQIAAPNAVVDLVDDPSGNGYSVNFYTPTGWTPDPNQGYMLVPDPNSTVQPSLTKTYRVSMDSSSKMRIVEREGQAVHVRTVELTSGTVSSGTYVWTMDDGGNNSGNPNAVTWLRRVVVTSTNSGNGAREEVQEVRETGGAVVTSTKFTYTTFPWGEEVTQKTENYGGTLPRTTTYDYHTDANSAGNFRHLKSIAYPDGRWEAYSYYDDDSDWGRRGLRQYEYGPWLDSPASPSGATLGAGRVTSYDYTLDWLGRRNVLANKLEYVNGVQVGSTTIASNYTLPAQSNGNNVFPQDITAASGTGTSTYTRVRSVRVDSLPDMVGRPLVQQNPDHTRACSQYYYGSYDAATKVFAVWSGTTFFKEVTTRGVTDWLDGGVYTTSGYGGSDIEPIYLIPYRSTAEVKIRNVNGDVVRTETYVFTGGSDYTLISSADYTYDVLGRLTDTVQSNGATTHATYADGRMQSARDASGTETTYTYDEIGRVHTATKSAVAAAGSFAAQSAIVTTYTYDASGRATATSTSAGGLTKNTSAAYDRAGFVTSSTDAGGYTTTYTLSNGGRTKTTTLPGLATQIDDRYADGRTRSATGTSRVPEYYTYWVGTDSLLYSKVNVGAADSPVQTQTCTDWLGRTTAVWHKTFDDQFLPSTSSYNSLGQLTKTTEPGRSATLYAYNAMGQQIRTALDVNGNDQIDLGSVDRVTSTDSTIWSDGTAWWSRSTTTAESNVDQSLPVLTSETLTRLTGFAAGTQAETQSYDIHRNKTVAKTLVDRAAHLVTSTVKRPDTTATQSEVVYNGLKVSVTDSANLTTTYGYDALGRLSTVTDPRTGTSTTTYVGTSNQVLSQTDATNTTVATYSYDSAGRVFSTRNTSGNFTYTTYNDRGQTEHVWGDVPYPVEYGYDTYGRQWKMRTFRAGSGWSNNTWPANPGTADETTWNYHAATGLLASKVDAQGRAVSYTYNARGQTLTRTWARAGAVTTTYGYDPATAELTSTTYSDGTPSVTITYNARGQVRTVADATGTRMLHYSASNFLNLDETLGDFYNGRVVTWKYDTAAGVVGRNAGFSLGRPSNLTGENDIAYGYDGFGRFNGLTATLSGVSAGSFTYGYTPASNQIGSLSESGSGLVQSRSYEPHRDLVSGFATTLGSRTLASYGYTNDELGRRTIKVEAGEMYSRYGPGLTTRYGYNARSEVTSSNTYVGTDPAVASTAAGDALQGRSFYYGYDNIGNRDATTVNGQSSSYSNNSLNQVTSRTVPGYADVSGFVAANATVTVAGQPTVRQFDYFYRQHPLGNGTSSLWASLAVSATVPGGATANETRYMYLAKSLEEFTYDEDGNLKSDGRWDYSWDAENRLVSMTTTDLAAAVGVPRKALQFKYDYMGRRVQKTVNSWSGSAWAVASQTRFVYSTTNWHLLAEYDAQNRNAVVRTYSWGLDLSRTTTGAGGVGGLLALYDTATGASYLPAYDANGNVLAIVNRGSATIAAAYEYSAFGETVRATGSFAEANPIRFSTKYTDAETQLVYYGYRYYNPSGGRFLGRDPIEEKGGLHLYAFCGNDGVNRWDFLGMEDDWLYVMGMAQEGHRIWAGIMNTMRQAMDNARSDAFGYDFIGAALGWHDSQIAAAGQEAYYAAIAEASSQLAQQQLNNAASITPPTFNGTIAPTNTSALAIPPASSSTAAAPDAPNNAAGSSALGNALRDIPLIGGILGGVGDIVSGVGNTALGIASLGQSGTLDRGLAQIGSGIGGTVDILGRDMLATGAGLVGTAYTTVRDVANLATFGKIGALGDKPDGGGARVATGVFGALARTVQDALIPEYGMFGGKGWGADQGRGPRTALNSVDFYSYIHDRDFGRDVPGANTAWVRNNWSPPRDGQVASGPIGIAYVLAGTLPFLAADAFHKKP